MPHSAGDALELIVDRTFDGGLAGRVTVSHAYGFCQADPAVQARLIERLADAGVTLLTQPSSRFGNEDDTAVTSMAAVRERVRRLRRLEPRAFRERVRPTRKTSNETGRSATCSTFCS